jgi:diguanylate cyclase (GGDEF)-like protein
MRITTKIFDDLAIFMVALGVLIGLIFPFFSLLLGVSKEIAIRPTYFFACIIAGILLGLMNITIARVIIGGPMKQLSHKMRHVQTILVDKKNGISEQICTPENCFIYVESKDELGESADAFNSLVVTLSEVLETNAEINAFSDILTSNLELEILAQEALAQLIKNSEASGGAILIEKNGELEVIASIAIRNSKTLGSNERVLHTSKTFQRQIIDFPNEVILDGIVVDFHPKTLLVEPITYKNILLGVVILANTQAFSKNSIDKLTFFSQSLSLALRNAITHNQMQKLAALDGLTGLYNRRFGTIRLQEEYGRAIRANLPISILMFDIDHFKSVNDTYGHLTGDRVLISIAKTATAAIREGDVLLRYGGEEFLCILPGANQKDAKLIAERIRVMVMDSVVKNAEQEIKVTISIGTATFPNPAIDNCEEFVQLADQAMYTAKETGRNRIISN